MSINKMIIKTLYLVFFITNSINCLDSYLYLSDKVIREEIPIGSYVVDLTKELETNQVYKKLTQSLSPTVQQFTLLDDSKLINGNGYFQLDPSSGILSTKRQIDREYMCSNRQCSESCETTSGSCRINLKILLMPSYNILNLNIFIEDINDNKPVFRSANITQQINENVPIGYKIPIDLAFDPDIGSNSIDHYELRDRNTRNSQAERSFRLLQNLNESQLYLVVDSKLDRELIPSYNFTVIAYDGGSPSMSGSLNMNVELIDINDNNPVFERNLYKYTISEDTAIDTVIGRIKATDLDQGPNGHIKYRFVDNGPSMNHHSNDHRFVIQKNGNVVQSKQNVMKYFDLDETTGVIRLKMPLDFEDESFFSLTVEARDSGVGSLPAHATIDINVVDVNDNPPEISVSFLNTIFKNQSQIAGFKYDVYIPENTKTNKFLAHVSIVDKDSMHNNNGKLDWKIMVNDKLFYSSKKGLVDQSEDTNYLKLIKLNNNSFTLNVGSQQLMDRERNDHFNVSIQAWDYGKPKLNDTIYNFMVRLIDTNDNAPKFEKYTYEESIYENNEPFQAIFKVNAVDLDSTGPNSNITYTIKEPEMNEFFYIDKNGQIYAKIRFDREIREKYQFQIIAEDGGQPHPLSSTALVNLNVLDINDNHPVILFNTSYYHKILSSPTKVSKTKEKNSFTLLLKLGQNTPANTKIIDFKGLDNDSMENSFVEFSLDSDTNYENIFKLTTNGHFVLTKSLDKHIQDEYEFTIICRDLGTNPNLYSTINLKIEIVDKNEYCIKMKDDMNLDKNASDELRIGFYNRDQPITNIPINLFKYDFVLINEKLNKLDNKILTGESHLSVELLTHKDLIEAKTYKIDTNKNLQRLELNFKSTLTYMNLTRLMLGKYTIKLRLIDDLNPTCIKLETFTLLIGNNFINKKEMITFLQTYKQKNLIIKNNTIISNDENKIKSEQDLINTSDPEEQEMNPTTNNNDNDEDDYMDKSSSSKKDFIYAKNKHKFSLMKSDYILLFILIVIIVITSILFVFIAIICIYSKYKKQYSKKKKNSNARNDEKNNDDDADNLHLPTNRYLTNKKIAASKKNKLLNAADLNTSSSSTTSSQTNSDNLTKPQYTLVNNKSSSSSSSSCNATTSNAGTLIYSNHHLNRDVHHAEEEDDEDEFGLLSANTISRKLRDSKHNYQIKQQQMLINQRYLYSTLAKNPINNYHLDSNRSNSVAESMIDSVDSSPTDCNIIVIDNQSHRATLANNSGKLNSLKLKHEQNQHQSQQQQQHSSSSAYSSITNSELIDSNHNNDDSVNCSPTNNNSISTSILKTNSSIIKKPNDSNLLSFKKNFNTLNHINNNNNVNSYSNNYTTATTTRPNLRTSFNL